MIYQEFDTDSLCQKFWYFCRRYNMLWYIDIKSIFWYIEAALLCNQ